uniref:Ovule protein n=1 Tax=Panagrellus redivivus TaxID=6233 RepID=A0A7E4UWZ1_PANRE
MASINLGTAVRSLTRSILLNTGKKLGHDHDHDHDENASHSNSPPMSPTGSLSSNMKIKEIANKIRVHHDDSLHEILLKTKSSPMLKQTTSYVKGSEADFGKSSSQDVFDENTDDDKDFPYTDGYHAGDDYDNVTFTVPSMEHGTALFK